MMITLHTVGTVCNDDHLFDFYVYELHYIANVWFGAYMTSSLNTEG